MRSELMTAAELEAYLRSEIPLTQAMQLRVVDLQADAVRLAAPLAPNINHRDTAFGGSISTLGIMAGWALIHAKLSAAGCDARLVIQDSHTTFIRPIDAELQAECRTERAETWNQFFATLQRKGRARLALRSEMHVGERIAAVHDGVYVAVAATDKAPPVDDSVATTDRATV